MVLHKFTLRHQPASSFYLFLALAGVLLTAALVLVLSNGLAARPATSVSTASQYHTYQNKDYAYFISYPANWQVVNPYGGVFSATSALKSDDTARGGTNFSQRKLLSDSTPTPAAALSKIDVIAYDLESPMTVQDFMTAKSSSVPEGRLTNLKLSGQPALRVETRLSEALDNHTDSLTYTSVFVTVGKHGYIISGVAASTLFDYILNSFQAV